MRNCFLKISAFAVLAVANLAYAQFGSGIVYDPTQSAHAIEQISQGQQIFTNSVRLADNAIATYNLAHEMSLAPQTLYQPFLSPSTYWLMVNQAANTYGNTREWTNSVNTGVGAPVGYQQASIPRTGQINGYGNLSAPAQQQIAAQGATADLNDSITANNMQTLGTIRANAQQRQADINALIRASQSADLTQHTSMMVAREMQMWTPIASMEGAIVLVRESQA